MGDDNSLGQIKVPVTSSARPKPARLPPFNVVLLDDNDHSYEYVIVMLRKVFGYSEEAGYKMAKEVDSTKRVIVFTSHKELAELRREQMISCCADPRMQRSAGPMSVILEPAE